jgi:hypothetical protein
VGRVPDPSYLRKCGSAGNRTRDLWILSQELRPQRRSHSVTGLYEYRNLVLQVRGRREDWCISLYKKNYCCELQRTESKMVWLMTHSGITQMRQNLPREAVAEKGLFCQLKWWDESRSRPKKIPMLTLKYGTKLPRPGITFPQVLRATLMSRALWWNCVCFVSHNVVFIFFTSSEPIFRFIFKPGSAIPFPCAMTGHGLHCYTFLNPVTASKVIR